MKNNYKDITSRIAQSPIWFDENGVPRYEPFSPDQCVNIYAQECVLLRIACQECHQQFDVCMSCGDYVPATLRGLIVSHEIDYGDPPNIGCCPAGPTMNSEVIRVLQYWSHGGARSLGWMRDATFELPSKKRG